MGPKTGSIIVLTLIEYKPGFAPVAKTPIATTLTLLFVRTGKAV